jgi:hypothetical protein
VVDCSIGMRYLHTTTAIRGNHEGTTSGVVRALKNSNRLEYLIDGLREGNRGCLAESITLVETEHPQKKLMAKRLLDHILNYNKTRNNGERSFRIGQSHSLSSVQFALI